MGIFKTKEERHAEECARMPWYCEHCQVYIGYYPPDHLNGDSRSFCPHCGRELKWNRRTTLQASYEKKVNL